MTNYLVTIQDKELPGEPTVGLAVVAAIDHERALDAADAAIEVLARAGRCRCVASAREFVEGFFYRLSSVVVLPKGAADGMLGDIG